MGNQEYLNKLNGMNKSELVEEAIRLLTRNDPEAIQRNREVVKNLEEPLRGEIYKRLPHLRDDN